MSTNAKYNLPPSMSVSRRFVLGGLAAIPAVAAPGRALSALEAPDIGTELPRALAGLPAAERASAAWVAFTSAMDELTANFNGGWVVHGLSRRAYEGSQRIEQAAGLQVRGVSFIEEAMPRLPKGFMTVERHHLMQFTSDRLEEIAL